MLAQRPVLSPVQDSATTEPPCDGQDECTADDCFSQAVEIDLYGASISRPLVPTTQEEAGNNERDEAEDGLRSRRDALGEDHGLSLYRGSRRSLPWRSSRPSKR